uniref:TRAM domain-containing protein n=1 Tax=candidate division WOR-3 bacterium TaxID=2052148 RepID=A0A7V3KPJ4_UNCW3
MSWLNIRRIIVFLVLFGLITFVGIRAHLSYYLSVAAAALISYSVIALEKLLSHRNIKEVGIFLATIIAGALFGTFIGFLIIQFPDFRRPETRGWVFLITNTAAIYLFVAYVSSRKDELIKSKDKIKGEMKKYTKLVDTSALIDGRIVDMVELGFLEGNLGVPAFVLKELQNIADSKDPDKREKGRRGMEMLDKLRDLLKDRLIIVREDVPGKHDVDEKLIELARKNGAKLITTDYNLKKIAEVQGVSVLNVNELTERLKLPLNSGDIIKIKIVREGKERDKKQGVGYLVDGTMVVVDGASSYIGQEIEVIVHSVLQTETGRIVFARLKGEA